MFAVAASLCLYVACLCLFHAHPRRTAFDKVKAQSSYQTGMRVLAAGLALLSLVIFIAQVGVEKGIAMWLGVFVAAGILSLMISALKPAYHVKSGILSVGLGVLTFGGIGIGALI
ncbi:MAG: DUF3325 family protein [Pseudomonadota bacterium]